MITIDNAYLSDGYAPVHEEVTARDLEVTGGLPPELNGRWLRNGPNPVGDVDPAVVERERRVFTEQVAIEGKPEHIRARIVEGKLGKFFKQRVLLEQAFVKDPDRSVGELITETAARTGEKITVARFSRFQVGG